MLHSSLDGVLNQKYGQKQHKCARKNSTKCVYAVVRGLLIVQKLQNNRINALAC